MNIESFITYNKSCKKKLVFVWGGGGSFFSEYNNMILAIVFCFEHKIQFAMYNKKEHFIQWNDLFVSFCDKCTDDIHDKYNYRFIEKNKSTISFRIFLYSILLAIKHHNINRIRPYYCHFFENKTLRKLKEEYHFNYFTYDVWFDIRNQDLDEQICVDGIFKGTRRELCREISRIIWCFNSNAQSDIQNITNKYSVDRHFVGLHIRRGDKWIESPLVPIENYMKHIVNDTYKDLFVMSDDYSTVETIMKTYPNYNITTFESPKSLGWSVDIHYSLSQKEWYSTLIPFLASIEIMKKADVILCTISSGIGLYLDLMCHNKVINCDV